MRFSILDLKLKLVGLSSQNYDLLFRNSLSPLLYLSLPLFCT